MSVKRARTNVVKMQVARTDQAASNALVQAVTLETAFLVLTLMSAVLQHIPATRNLTVEIQLVVTSVTVKLGTSLPVQLMLPFAMILMSVVTKLMTVPLLQSVQILLDHLLVLV